MIRDLTSLTLAIPAGRMRHGVIGGGVSGGGGVRSILRHLAAVVNNRLVFGQIIHTDALPHRINSDSHTKEHDLPAVRGGGRRLAAQRHFLSQNGTEFGLSEMNEMVERISAFYIRRGKRHCET